MRAWALREGSEPSAPAGPRRCGNCDKPVPASRPAAWLACAHLEETPVPPEDMTLPLEVLCGQPHSPVPLCRACERRFQRELRKVWGGTGPEPSVRLPPVALRRRSARPRG